MDVSVYEHSSAVSMDIWSCNLYLPIKIENHPFIPLLAKFLLLLNPLKGSLK